jgi:hypothetical protein
MGEVKLKTQIDKVISFQNVPQANEKSAGGCCQGFEGLEGSEVR